MGDFDFREGEKYISFSQIDLFEECGWHWKLAYVDKIKIKNIYLVFGNSVHETIEKLIEDSSVDPVVVFQTRWKENYRKFLTDDYIKKESKKKDFIELCKDMYRKGPELSRLATSSIKEQFPGWEVLFVELPLKSLVNEETNLHFIAKIDVVLTDGERIAVVDWKTSSWGWGADKRNDKMRHYQLMYYKHFYSEIYEVSIDKIDCYFALVKRTAKKEQIEYIPVKGGKKKIENSLKVMNQVIYNMENKKYVKNLNSCTFCPFRKTEKCPGS